MQHPLPYQMQVINQVLYVRLFGVWSSAVVSKVMQQLPELISPIEHQPWAALVDMRDWIMPTMEALSGFDQIYQWCLAHNQTHEATVCKLEMQRRLVADVSSYNQASQLYTPSIDKAVSWLNQKGFTFELPSAG
ncbi:hypothetical protein GCM10009092_36210 [Bowmanella denitrificans]|uniref:STAS/SEC14 domain-containing protein n=1 Tax=Bowmanella denitrificans TaxID=366582 RepID=A0ABN0XNC5_9ALTE